MWRRWYSTCCYRCSRTSTDVNKGTFCTVRTFYWIITPYHESLETLSTQTSTDTGVTNRRLSIRNGSTWHVISRLITFDSFLPHRTCYRRGCGYWSAENPKIIPEHPLHPQKVIVWTERNIIKEIRNLTPDILRKVIETLIQRMCLCLNNNSELV